VIRERRNIEQGAESIGLKASKSTKYQITNKFQGAKIEIPNYLI